MSLSVTCHMSSNSKALTGIRVFIPKAQRFHMSAFFFPCLPVHTETVTHSLILAIMSHKLHTFCFVLLTIHYVHLGALCSHSNCQIRFYGPDCQHNFHFTSPSLSSILSLMVLISLPPTYFCTFLLSLLHIILNRFFFFLRRRHLV